MHCHPLAILLALGLGAAAVHAGEVDGDGEASSAGGRRLRRNPDRRQMQDVLVVDDAQDTDVGESIVVADFGDDGTTTDAPLGGQNLCKTIIAIDGWRLDQRKGGRELLQPPDDAGLVDLGLGDIDLLGDGNSTAPYEDVTIPYEDDPLQQIDTDEEFVCELQDGKTLPLQGTREQLAEMRTLLNNGTFVSAQSSVVADRIGGSVSNGEGGEYAIAASAPEAVALPAGSIQLIHNEEDDFSRRRRLNRYNGDKRFLIVIVKDKDGRVIPEKANVVSNKWFGTSGDPVNMARGFKECSFNKFRATWNYGNALDSNQKSKLSAKGVIEVTIPIRITTSTQEQIRYAAVVAVQQKLQMMLPGPFDHVVFLVKKCHAVGAQTCAWAAYAYVKHWLSLFVEDNWKYAAVQMHEIGHNLNMAHSGGLDRKTYTDHTCLMGNPLWEDNVGRMCFNPVKAFQINKANGWYNPSQVQTWNSGTTEGATWSGRLLGVARGGNNPHNHPIVLKLETGSRADWFIGYNHAVGPNSDTVQGRNRVTVYKVAGGDGMHYSHSHLKAILRANQRGTINNWRNTGKNLYIQVKTVSASASAGYADVTITFGQSTPPPTPKPTPNPTQQPTPQPTPNPTQQPTPLPSKAPSTSPSKAPSSSPTIKTPDPTSPPSRSPTASPSDAPTTAMPSKAPSQAPSPAPTGWPSSNPSLSPTLTTSPSLSLSPSVDPTAKPTTAPPTARPTARPTNQCGNGICDASESSSSCPADCITRTFTATNSNGGRSSTGQMFTMKAKRSVKVQAVQVVGKSNARSRCMVFTRRGSYRGHVQNQGSWTKLVDRWVNMRSGRTVSLGNFNRLVALKAGETQAFYVYCSKGMLYARGGNEGARYSSNNALDLLQGIGTRSYFGKKVRKGKFRGSISYVETR